MGKLRLTLVVVLKQVMMPIKKQVGKLIVLVLLSLIKVLLVVGVLVQIL
jgi:hypothetical protein